MRISDWSADVCSSDLPISQASANQRAGRCGRIGPGVCVRLYADDDFKARAPFTDPEVLRSSLASVILRMTALKLDDIESFPFVDPPPGRAIDAGYHLVQARGRSVAGRVGTECVSTC